MLAEAVEVDQRTLLGLAEEKVVQAEVEDTCTIRNRRGSEVIEVPIPCTN